MRSTTLALMLAHAGAFSLSTPLRASQPVLVRAVFMSEEEDGIDKAALAKEKRLKAERLALQAERAALEVERMELEIKKKKLETAKAEPEAFLADLITDSKDAMASPPPVVGAPVPAPAEAAKEEFSPLGGFFSLNATATDQPPPPPPLTYGSIASIVQGRDEATLQLSDSQIEACKSRIFDLESFYVMRAEQTFLGTIFRGNLRTNSSIAYASITEKAAGVPELDGYKFLLLDDPISPTLEDLQVTRPPRVISPSSHGLRPPLLTIFHLANPRCAAGRGWRAAGAPASLPCPTVRGDPPSAGPRAVHYRLCRDGGLHRHHPRLRALDVRPCRWWPPPRSARKGRHVTARHGISDRFRNWRHLPRPRIRPRPRRTQARPQARHPRPRAIPPARACTTGPNPQLAACAPAGDAAVPKSQNGSSALFAPHSAVPQGLFGCITRLLTFAPNRQALFDFAFAGPAVGYLLSIFLYAAGILLSVDLTLPPGAAENIAALASGALPGADAANAAADAASTAASATASFSASASAAAAGASASGATSLADLSPVIPSSLLATSFLLGGLADAMLPGLSQEPAVAVHPLVVVGFVGAIVNALQLLPIGRLDGGRIASAVLGQSSAGLLSGIMLLALGMLRMDSNPARPPAHAPLKTKCQLAPVTSLVRDASDA